MQSKVHLKKIEMQVAPRLKAKAKLMHSKIEHESQGKLRKTQGPLPTYNLLGLHRSCLLPGTTENRKERRREQRGGKGGKGASRV